VTWKAITKVDANAIVTNGKDILLVDASHVLDKAGTLVYKIMILEAMGLVENLLTVARMKVMPVTNDCYDARRAKKTNAN